MISIVRQYLPAFLLMFGLATSPLLGQETGQENVSLTPGDAINIVVWRSQELSGEFTIAADGSINHPLYRSIQVTGVPFSVAEQRIRDFLETLEANPQFTAQPLLRVSVGGQVRQPSLYRLPPETSIAEAVAQAGGVSEQGRLDQVRLTRRGDSTEIRVDLTSPEFGLAQQPIRSGDQIFVERRGSFWREYVTPAGSIVAALVSLVNIIISTR